LALSQRTGSAPMDRGHPTSDPPTKITRRLNVDGGANMYENRRFEIVGIFWHKIRLPRQPFRAGLFAATSWQRATCSSPGPPAREEGRRHFRRTGEEKPGKNIQFQTGGFNAFPFRR